MDVKTATYFRKYVVGEPLILFEVEYAKCARLARQVKVRTDHLVRRLILLIGACHKPTPVLLRKFVWVELGLEFYPTTKATMQKSYS